VHLDGRITDDSGKSHFYTSISIFLFIIYEAFKHSKLTILLYFILNILQDIAQYDMHFTSITFQSNNSDDDEMVKSLRCVLKVLQHSLMLSTAWIISYFTAQFPMFSLNIESLL
jgi:hypothetical protein